MFLFTFTLGVITLALPLPPTQWAKAQDDSLRQIARISLIQGDVSTKRGGSSEWMAATANAPIARGDSLAAGPASRTELQLDFGNTLRLDQGTEAEVAELSRTRIQIQVASGLTNLSVSRGAEADVEIDTPNMAIHILGEGAYRLQVKSGDYAQLTVGRGRAQVFAGRGSMNVAGGQTIYVKGTAVPDYQLTQAPMRDGWDRWNDERDHTMADAQSWKYTNRYYTGSEDLDRYGDWIQVPGYGWCWTPYADAGWVPYRDGRWVSDSYYQWMWVGYEPWGWAPYHYGRWLFYDGNWCWWPGLGGNGARPMWTPGYVAFIGLGGRPGGTDSRLEFDSIGWCPLGPHDRFEPWWGPGRTLSTKDITSLNAAATSESPVQQVSGSNLQGILTDPNLRAAVTTLSVQNFANGRIGHDLYPVNESILEQGSLVLGPLPVAPAKSSLQPVDRPVNRAALPASTANNHHFVTRSVGPTSHLSESAGPVNPSMTGQQPPASISAQNGLVAPSTRPDTAGPRPNTAIGAPPAGPVNEPTGAHAGWRRFTWGNQITHSPTDVNRRDADGRQLAAPVTPSATPPASDPTPQGDHSGWRHFTPPADSAHHGGGVSSQDQSGWKHFGDPPKGNSPASRGEQYRI